MRMVVFVLQLVLLSSAQAGGESAWRRDAVPARPVERPLQMPKGWALFQSQAHVMRLRDTFGADGARQGGALDGSLWRSSLRVDYAVVDRLTIGTEVAVARVGSGTESRLGFDEPTVWAQLGLLESRLPTASMALSIGFRPSLRRVEPNLTTVPAESPGYRDGQHRLQLGTLTRLRTGAFRWDTSAYGVIRLGQQPSRLQLGHGLGLRQEVLLQLGPAHVGAGADASLWGPDRYLDMAFDGGWQVDGRLECGLAFNRVLGIEFAWHRRLRGRPTWWVNNPSVSPMWGAGWGVAVHWRH